MYELILNNIARHIDLTDEERSVFLEMLRPRSLKKKQRLVSAGDVFTWQCFVRSGALKTCHIDEDGFEHIVQLAFEDWWTGDMFSFVSAKPALYYINAIEDTELLMLERMQVERLYKLVPKFERFFRILIQNSLVSHQKRISDNLSMTGEQRYLNFIQQYAKYEQRLSIRQIASYLGVTPESLSRIRRQLANK